jgi:hypothetical protein
MVAPNPPTAVIFGSWSITQTLSDTLIDAGMGTPPGQFPDFLDP